MNNLRVAWLLPTAWFYWQPVMSEFTKLFPHTKVFTALFPGFAQGLENSIAVEVIGKQRKLEFKAETTSYSSYFTYMSPRIIMSLLGFKPQIIFASSFGIWTVLALLFKPIGRWKVIIAYEGSSPTVDYRNSWIRLAIRRVMVKTADACISNSQAGKEYLIEYLNANKDSVFAQPYEVPDIGAWSKFTPDEKYDLEHCQKPIFLFVGKVVPRKGLNLLLQSCVLLQQKGIDQYTVIVIGDGSQRPELEVFCQENRLEEQVKWLGQIDYSKLGHYFQAADVFVLPTFEDTWGMVILEAMLCGKPILCSKEAGASELVIEGESGYCFRHSDIKKLAEILIQFINNPNLKTTMGKKSRQIIAQHTPEKAAKFLTNMVSLVMQTSLQN